MISIRKFLDSRPEQAAAAFLRTVQLLLEGIERSAVKMDAADYESFQRDWRSIADRLKEDTPASDILVLAGEALKALENHNGGATRQMRAQCDDLQNMVGMLTKAMAAVTAGSQSSIARLQEIEGTLQKASQLEDFHTAKIRMSECLDVLSKEIVRHRTESARQVSDMSSAMQGLRTARPDRSPEAIARHDPLTGLVERAGAEAALAEAAKGATPAFAAVFVTDRLDLINARFGRSAGDNVLVFFCQHIAQALKQSDRLFRWTGPGVVAVLQRGTALPTVREEMNGLFAKRLTMNITVENRSVLLAVPAKWTVLAVQEHRPLPRLIQRIDAFVHGEPPELKPQTAGTGG